METPVAFFIYRRPELTEKVFAEIARAKPNRLLVVADGPKSDEEARQCLAARAVVDNIDWSCSVQKQFSEKNLGCRKRLSSGLDWVFENCEEAIILEDDTLPHPSFFPFCEELLERYRQDERIMMIGGINLQAKNRTAHSYYFSCCTHIWGWATWRRAWNFYDVDMRLWPKFRETPWLSNLLGSLSAAEFWRPVFDRVHQGQIDTWDYQWMFSCWSQNGLAILPAANLVSNIGFGEEATHTGAITHPLANRPVKEMAFPLNHPLQIVRNGEADRYTFEEYFYGGWQQPKDLLHRIWRKLSSLLR